MFTCDDLPAWLQALAGIILVGITAYYAKVTRDIAQSSVRQAALLERQSTLLEQERDLRRELRYSAALRMISRFRMALAGLPTGEATARADKVFRVAPVWSQGEVQQLTDAVGALGTGAAALCGGLADDLEWLRRRVADIQSTSTMQGYDYSIFPWPEWDSRWSNAQNVLAQIEGGLSTAMAKNPRGDA